MSDKPDPDAAPPAKPDPLADWPDARWGTAETPLPKVTPDTEPDPDDEEMAETPPDVIAMLGFDPLHMDDDDTEDAGDKGGRPPP